jgi:hypothetical protein
MGKLAVGEAQGDGDKVDRQHTAAPAAEADAMAAGMVGRARWLMIISGLTTLLAIAAVIGVIGYRIYRAGGSGAAATAEGIIVLPKGARVTLEIAGTTEICTFDVKTLKETGRIRFATEP